MAYRNRGEVALKLMGMIWDIHFPKGKAFNDEQFKLLCRDSYVLADFFDDVGELSKEELMKLGQPPLKATGPEPQPEPPKPPMPPGDEPLPAAQQTVEAIQ